MRPDLAATPVLDLVLFRALGLLLVLVLARVPVCDSRCCDLRGIWLPPSPCSPTRRTRDLCVFSFSLCRCCIFYGYRICRRPRVLVGTRCM